MFFHVDENVFLLHFGAAGAENQVLGVILKQFPSIFGSPERTFSRIPWILESGRRILMHFGARPKDFKAFWSRPGFILFVLFVYFNLFLFIHLLSPLHFLSFLNAPPPSRHLGLFFALFSKVGRQLVRSRKNFFSPKDGATWSPGAFRGLFSLGTKNIYHYPTSFLRLDSNWNAGTEKLRHTLGPYIGNASAYKSIEIHTQRFWVLS